MQCTDMEKKNNDMLHHMHMLLNMVQGVYSCCHRVKKYMCKGRGNVGCNVSRQLRPDAQEFVVSRFDYNARHFNLAFDYNGI